MSLRSAGSILAALVLAGCTAGAPTDVSSTPAGSTPTAQETPEAPTETAAPETPDPSPSPPTVGPAEAPPPPVPAGYELVAGESGAEAKEAAVALVETLTNYDADDGLAEVAARATDDPALADHLSTAAAPLHHPGAWSRGTIIYPQLGGLEVDAAAVITVVRQEVGAPDGSKVTQTRTLDVRVELSPGGTWEVSELASAGGEPVPRPDDLSAAARAVLDDERIELPDSARWDIHRGWVDEPLLELMSRIADRTAYGVVVLRTGHSREVFGTDRTSRHTEGRAVDLYRVGERLVIEDRDTGSGAHELVRWVYDRPELSEVGSPWALDEFGGRSFSDALHQDHLHIGTLRPGERQRSTPRT